MQFISSISVLFKEMSFSNFFMMHCHREKKDSKVAFFGALDIPVMPNTFIHGALTPHTAIK